ncbi:MAG: YfhO family protein [Lachnospiraceae bacterium]|nr:YfhO family protein [Lachnospiraceae bacterium]
MKKVLRDAGIAFILSALTFVIFLGLYQVLGYGNFTILRGDLYSQYISFIEMFLRVLRGEESFWYTFSLYYGSGTILTYAYYCLSPFNLLYLIPGISIPAMTTVIITLKVASAAFTFTIFAHKILKSSGKTAVFFAICYALNGFSMTFHLNMIWLDAVFMVPVIVILLFELIDRGRFLGLTVAWCYLFFTNFYMSYIVGVFSALVFLAILLYRLQGFHRSELRKALLISCKFAYSVLLAFGLCAITLVPTAFFLKAHMAADNFAFENLTTSPFSIFNSMFIGEMPELDNRVPFLYCGLPVLLLFPFYFFQKKFPKKERLIVGILLLFYLLCMLYLPLFVFMHAFDYPNWYGFRFSFCVIFVLCAIACRTSSNMIKLSGKHLLYLIAGLILLYSFMVGWGPLTSRSYDISNTNREMCINILFLVLWFVCFTVLQKASHVSKKMIRSFLCFLCFLLLIAELSINGYLSMSHLDLTPVTEDEYNNWYPYNTAMLKEIKSQDPGFYRIIANGETSSNAPCLFGYAGFNTFSSSDDYPLRRALSGLGISTVNRSIAETGYTDLTYLLFGAKYAMMLPRSLNEAPEGTDPYYEKLPFSLPIAYMVSADIADYIPEDDPFANQEQLIRCMTGNSYHFFEPLDYSDMHLSSFNANMTYSGNYNYFYKLTNLVPNATLAFSAPVSDGKQFFGCLRQHEGTADYLAPFIPATSLGFASTTTLSFGCALRGGTFEDQFGTDTETVAIHFTESTVSQYACKNMYFTYFDPTALETVYNDLGQNAFQIDQFFSDHIHGVISVPEDRPVFFTSIPYDSGWQAFVDGSPAKTLVTMQGAFLALALDPGVHEITLQYIAPGSRLGATITLCSLILLFLTLLLLWFAPSKRSKSKE